MLNKAHFLLMILTLTITISGCEKDDAMPELDRLKLLSSEQSNGGETILYFYDNNDRVSMIETPEVISNYFYEGNRIIVEGYIVPIQDSVTSEVFLNDRSLADSIVTGNETTIYEYDDNDYLIKEIRTINSFVSSERRYFYDANNNLERVLGYFSASVTSNAITETILYTYYENEENERSNYNRGLYYGGKPSENLLKSSIYERSDSDILSFNDYSYDRDSDGCLLSVTVESYSSSFPNNRSSSTIYLTYQ